MDQLREHVARIRPVPRLVSARARWLADDHDRRAALERGGLPECPWAAAWADRIEALHDLDDISAAVRECERHAEDCGICTARSEYLDSRFPEQDAFPAGGWLGVLQTGFARLEPYLALEGDPTAGPLRRLLTKSSAGAIVGGGFAAALLAFPAALFLLIGAFTLVFGPRPSIGEVAEAIAFGAYYVGSGAAAGAVGGSLWKLLPGFLGDLTVGVGGMSVFMFLLVITQDGSPVSWESSTWGIWAILSVIFGIACGWGLHKADALDGA